MKRRLLPSILITLLLVTTKALAIDSASLDLAKVSGPGWQASQVHLSMRLQTDGSLALELNAADAQLPSPLGRQHNLQISCARARADGQWFSCPAARARLRLPGLDSDRLQLSFRYRPADKTLAISIPATPAAGGKLRVTARLGPNRWSADVHASQVDTAKLAALTRQLGFNPGKLSLTGRADVDARLNGDARGISRASFELKLPGFGFIVGDGSNAAEALDLNAQGHAQRAGDDTWRFDATVGGHAGTLCLNACWDLPRKPLTAHVVGSARPGQVSISSLTLDQPGKLQVAGHLTVSDKQGKLTLHDAHVVLHPSDLAELYSRYLQPLLIGTAGEALEAGGRVSGKLDYGPGGMAASLNLQDVNVDDRKGRFGLYGLGGQLDWASSGPAHPAQLHWKGGHLFHFDLGAASTALLLGARSIELTRPANIGILDGALQVDRFHLDYPASGDVSVQFDGVLEPVSMQAVTHALGWPAMSGKLSGVIPAVTYDHGSLNVGGVLLVRAFDGTVTIRGLSLQHLFGLVPTLAADIDIDRLDLDALTRTFSFGNMQGRVSGYIHGLRMQDWKPVAFDARLATPEHDDSRHRISQKAVDNLTSIGGGGLGGALQRSFLSFFKEFSYSRLGLSCRLANGVCRMGGVAPAPHGYYIVKGGGLPRIDIVGYQQQVDWNELVERLKSAIASSAPVVQ